MGPSDLSRTAKELTGQVFSSQGNFISYDTLRGNFMAIALLYRGDVCPKDMIDAVLHVKNHYKPKIVEWAPCAFKLGCNRQQPTFDEECIFEASNRMVTRLVNNTIVYEQLENFCSTFDHMYAFRSFVHWYNRFGMEEDEFAEARTHIEKLIREYKTIHILGE